MYDTPVADLVVRGNRGGARRRAGELLTSQTPEHDEDISKRSQRRYRAADTSRSAPVLPPEVGGHAGLEGSNTRDRGRAM